MWWWLVAGAVVVAVLVTVSGVLRYRRLSREHHREMRIAARELGELDRLGGAAGEILFERRDVRDPE